MQFNRRPNPNQTLRWWPHQWAQQHLWQSPQHSPAYRHWRRGFVRDRLSLALWVAILGQIFLEAISILLVAPLKNWSQAPGFQINWPGAVEDVQVLAISLFCLLLGLVALKYSRCAPIRLLPWFTLSVLVLPEQFHWLAGLRHIDGGVVGDMAIVFWCQAILVPVQWRVHLLSHTLTLLGLLGFGWLSWSSKTATAAPVAILLWSSWFLFYSLLIIAIANLLVWYAERLLWQEFSLREQLQQFLQAMSQDLRSPIEHSHQMLHQLQLRMQPGASDSSIILSSATVDQLLQHNHQQLDLLNHLLAAARPGHAPGHSPGNASKASPNSSPDKWLNPAPKQHDQL